ncbi:cation-translocating P-type ATPase [Polynucleobacter sinensis]|uniref:cation-translocating P-type ATPase n=1 Tax=Polynucleobacter sinensis TaxID=1743157 RepID=UPI000782F29D|nr:cation-translocating P-type ATPase [Polynucleobacter sinensis]
MASNHLGLNSTEVKKLQELHGFNELPSGDRHTFLRSLFKVLTEPMFGLLLIAGGIYLVIGSVEDALILLGFIAISITITLYQQRKSEKAIDALKDLSSPRALVIRNGIKQRIAGREVVVGDLLILEEGSRIAADARLLEAHDLLVDESLLTGESVPVDKLNGQLIYSGCLVLRGGATAVVEAIGLQTELGKIGKSLGEIEEAESPLQQDIATLIKQYAIYGLVLSIIVFLIYGLLYKNWLQGALSGISLTMALLPEEFTVILTVFMALGVWRISRQQVLTRHAPVIETLGSINTLCVDKTGTLTINKMTLQGLATPHEILDLGDGMQTLNFAQTQLLSYAVLASEIEPFDPMEKAFHESLSSLHKNHQADYANHVLAHEYPLSPDFPAMAHLWRTTDSSLDYVVAIKGSPEAVMSLCKLNNQEKASIEEQINAMASGGMRLLGVGRANYRKNTDSWPSTIHEFEYEWLGLVGLKDPLRSEVPSAVKQCQDAGIRVIMITGDHAVTAQAIARQAGIKTHRVLSGQEINQLSNEDLRDIVQDVSVFVRIKPEQKLRLVKALQENNEIVAMTGDGINDAPALKAAHVGIAMGQRGTDVAREASSLVLLNDDFSSIVNAIRQGRQIYDNLQKAIIYVIAVHIPIAGAVFIPLIFGAPPMLSPIHILFLEMIIDPTCAIVFEMESPEMNLMHRPPRDPKQKIFALNNVSLAIIQGIGLMAITVGLYLALLYLSYPQNFAITTSFGSLVLGNLLLIIISRSKREHIITILKKSNPSQKWIIGVTSISFMGLIFIPFLRERFDFSVIDAKGATLILAAGFASLLWCELTKFGFKKYQAI